MLFFPNSAKDQDLATCDELCLYVRSGNLMQSLVIAVLVLLVLMYIIYKVGNLFTKIRQSKQRQRKLKENLDYILSLQGSQVQGEGVKDQYLGILFKKNPAYKK